MAGNVAEWVVIAKCKGRPAFYRCSRCKKVVVWYKKKDWCPNCNAIMRN